jgi:hypothetical protein
MDPSPLRPLTRPATVPSLAKNARSAWVIAKTVRRIGGQWCLHSLTLFVPSVTLSRVPTANLGIVPESVGMKKPGNFESRSLSSEAVKSKKEKLRAPKDSHAEVICLKDFY